MLSAAGDPGEAPDSDDCLSLTDLGKAGLAGEEDFRRHNPIRRWWGGTLLTNDRLWRWDTPSGSLVAPD